MFNTYCIKPHKLFKTIQRHLLLEHFKLFMIFRVLLEGFVKRIVYKYLAPDI